MRLKPGSFAEYKRFHDEIWPELVAEIERSGIGQITIFENDEHLFLYSEIHHAKAWDRLWNSKVHDRWGVHMEPLMQFNSKGKVDARQFREIFHLETGAGRPARGRPGTGRVTRSRSGR